MARDLRARATYAERVAWKILRNRKMLGLKFRRQYPLFGYIVDFFCKPERLVIEIDGSAHDNPEAAAYDRFRENVLKSHGIRIIRLRNEHVTPRNLRREIMKFLELE